MEGDFESNSTFERNIHLSDTCLDSIMVVPKKPFSPTDEKVNADLALDFIQVVQNESHFFLKS